MTRKHSKTPSFNADAADNTGAATPEPVPTEHQIRKLQIEFYGLALPAEQQEIEAQVAAGLIAIPAPITVTNTDGKCETRFQEKREDEILKLLLIRGKNRDTKQPLTEWLRRAREHNIIYLPALDLAVENYSNPPLKEQNLAKDNSSTAHKNKPGPKPKVDDAQERVRLAAKNFFEVNKEAWNADQYPTWELLKREGLLLRPFVFLATSSRRR